MSSAVIIPPETARRVGRSCLCLHAQRAARALARRFDEAFRPLGLTNGQFSLLMALSPPRPKGIGEVADLLAMDRTTVTAKLKPLERRGLIAVAVDPDDKRGRRLSLTPSGHALLAEACPIWECTHAAVERDLADADRLRADLRALA